MAERNQVKVRLQTKAGISQWQDTRFFNTDSSVHFSDPAPLLPHVTQRSNSVRHQSRRLGVSPTAPARRFRARQCRVPRPLMLRVDARLTSISTTRPSTKTSIPIDKFFDTISFHRNHSAATEQHQLQRGQSHHDASSRCRSTALIDTPFGQSPSTRCVWFGKSPAGV